MSKVLFNLQSKPGEEMYIFMLGRYRQLSVSEISAVFNRLNYPIAVAQQSGQIAIVRTVADADICEVSKNLGGTVKAGRVIEIVYDQDTAGLLKKYFQSDTVIDKFFYKKSQACNFGISWYNCAGNKGTFDNLVSKTDAYLNIIKNTLEGRGIKSRYPAHTDEYLSSASVGKNNLIENGAEIGLVLTQDALLIAKTLWIQEFESFARRDIGRPVRDLQSGTMPPKLARMMINLSITPKTQTILDPFCGSGTIIQEALILGYRRIIGSDASEKAIEDTRNNISWLAGKENLGDIDLKLIKSDVSGLADMLGSVSVASVIREPYLGPNFRDYPLEGQINKIQSELKDLYINSFRQFYNVLKKGGRVVLILPVHNNGKSLFYLDVLRQITEIGFQQVRLDFLPRQTITIGNKKDFVLREAVKLIKN